MPFSPSTSAQAIQEAARELRVWAVLTSINAVHLDSNEKLIDAVQSSIDALSNAGMNSTNYVAVSHGSGGKYFTCYINSCDSGYWTYTPNKL